MQLTGSLGTSGVTYTASISAAGVISVAINAPVETLINAEVSKAGNSVLTEVVNLIEAALAAYVAAQPTPAPATT